MHRQARRKPSHAGKRRIRPHGSAHRSQTPRSAWRVALIRSAAAIAVACGAAPDAGAASELSGRIDAKVTNPGFTIVDNGTSITHAPLDDLSNATASTSYQGPVLGVDSTIVSILSDCAIGVGADVTGTSAVGVGSLRSAQGGGYFDYKDEILIHSDTLPAGTPVDVTFSFYAANQTMLSHSAFGETHYGNQNGAGVDYQFSANLSASGLGSIAISNGDNRFVQGEDLVVPGTTTGIMNPATPQLDVVFSGEVGATVSLQFRAFARIGVAVWSSGVGQTEVHNGEAMGAVAIAFGADPALPSVELQSTLYGGAYPDASHANATNAGLALTAITVPEPRAVGPFAIGALALLRAWRGRARRSACASEPSAPTKSCTSLRSDRR